VDVHGASRAVQGQQRQARDDRRQRERQIDHGVDRALAEEAVPDERPGDGGAGDGLYGRDRERDEHRQLQRRDPLCIGDGPPRTVRVCRPHERRERQQDDDAQVRDADADGEAGARALPSAGKRQRDRSSRQALARSWP
jgi:hypothetical protein